MNMTQSNNDKIQESISIIQRTLNPVSSDNTKIQYPLNRIVFGAPGTGKSNRLKDQSSVFENQKTHSQNIDEESCFIREISESENNRGKNFAIGLKYASFLKNQTPKILQQKYNITRKAAYTIYQGIRVSPLVNKLPDFSEEEISDEKIKEQLNKLFQEKYMNQAGAALIGYKYADYLSGRSQSDFSKDLGIPDTSLPYWVTYGIQAADYSFEEKKEESIKYYERVTFHPNYSYAQFVGTYKPITKIDTETNKEEISYEYVPGPFMRIYVNAIKEQKRAKTKGDTAKIFLLLIEEINRANVAAVFGDVFQLLDRDESGNSEYPITVSEDMKKYLAKNGIKDDEISIPSNMYIWATMNSADQGVLPMDAAFKRRWEFEYINIDDGATQLGDVKIPIPNGTKIVDDKEVINYSMIEWNILRTAINGQLKKVSGVNEDKLLGPFFIGDKTKIEIAAKDPAQFCKSFKSKVLMYLFEDVVKMQPGELFNSKDDENIHYSDICNDFDINGLKIFVKSISDQFDAFKNGDS